MFDPMTFNSRSQDMEEAYHDAGQFSWGKAEAFKQLTPVFSNVSSAYILPRYLVQDIDTQEDWIRAEMLYQAFQQSSLI